MSLMSTASGPVLSLQNWRSKHAEKLAGLSAKDIKQRYRQYVVSKQQGRLNRGVPRAERITMMPKLSKCAAEYLQALVNPFGEFDDLPCIPDVLTLPSYKFKTLARGTVNTGGSNVGFIATNDKLMFSDGVIYNGTTAAYTATDYDTGLAAPEYVSFGTNSPFTLATANPAGPKPTFRLVGAGIRIRYTGALINQGGTFTLYRSPGNLVVPTNTSIGTMLLNDTTARVPITNEWVYLNYKPTNNDALSYSQFDGSSVGGFNRVIMIQGTGPGQTFDFEGVQYFESQSAGIGQATHSHSDPVGMGSVLAALPNRGTPNRPSADVAPTLAGAGRELLNSTSGVVPAALDWGKRLGASIVGGPLSLLNSDFGSNMYDTARSILGRGGDYGDSRTIRTPVGRRIGGPVIVDLPDD